MSTDNCYKYNKADIRLTAGEVASLWSQYQSDTMVICVLRHFIAKLEDQELRPILEYALEQSQDHVRVIKDIFEGDKIPIPVGFTDNDVNINAPRLFTDVFMGMYIRHMAIIGMAAGAAAVGMCARSDISVLFADVVSGALELHDRSRRLLLEKGIYTRPPAISIPDKVEFVSKKSFLTGFFGEKRPLTAMEITHLFYNSQANSMGKAMMMGFAQVATSPDVKNFMQRGKTISSKHVKLFNDMLINEDLPAPMTWDANVTDATTSPFSDKLMMFHTSALNAAGIGNYAAAVATSQRRDIGLMYARLLSEIGLYAEDGVEIMIDNQWMEEPPQADDRNVLAKRS